MDTFTLATFFILIFEGALALTEGDAPACARPGELICNGCSALGVCVEEGQWLGVQDCSAQGLVCWRGACVAPEGEAAACAAEVGCFAAGAFPQLDDCSRYVECAGAGEGLLRAGAARSCPAGTRFDACTGRCDVLAGPHGGAFCDWEAAPGSVCSRAGEYGVAPENDRLYYSCVATEDGIQQRWSRCQLGHFDPKLLRCVDLDVPGCRRSDENGIQTTTTTIATTTTESPPKCNAGSSYPNLLTNCSYFFCKPDGDYLQVFCNDGFHFDAEQGNCVSGYCEDYPVENKS